MKVIRVTMPDGSKWDVPALIVAADRADNYEKKTTQAWHDEFKIAMSDDDVLADWARNNMNWSDVSANATRHAPASDIDYNDGWINGDMEIVEVPAKPATK